MAEARKLAAILVADVVGYSRLAGADEDRTLSRLRGLRSDLIDPAIDAHRGRVVKRTGDGSLIVAGALNAQLAAAEARRAEQAPTPNSMDLYFQGMAWLNKGITPDNVAKAHGFFDRALAADPGNVDAVVQSALANAVAGANAFATDPKATFAAAEAKLAKALSTVADHALAHLYLGFVEILTKRAAQGIAECEHALELDRNLAQAHALIGLGKDLIGRAEESEAHVVEALRLSPRNTLAYVWVTFAGMAKNQLGSQPAPAARHYG